MSPSVRRWHMKWLPPCRRTRACRCMLFSRFGCHSKSSPLFHNDLRMAFLFRAWSVHLSERPVLHKFDPSSPGSPSTLCLSRWRDMYRFCDSSVPPPLMPRAWTVCQHESPNCKTSLTTEYPLGYSVGTQVGSLGAVARTSSRPYWAVTVNSIACIVCDAIDLQEL